MGLPWSSSRCRRIRGIGFLSFYWPQTVSGSKPIYSSVPSRANGQEERRRRWCRSVRASATERRACPCGRALAGVPLRACPCGRALAGVSIRRGRLRRLPAQVLVRASAPREGSAGYDPPAGGSAAGGEGIPAKRGVRTVSQATSGRRTQAGAADATRRSPGTLLRSDEDLLPTPYGRHRRQSHARGDEDRPHARSQPPSDGHLYTCLRFVCVSPRVHNSAATPGARVFGHASRKTSVASKTHNAIRSARRTDTYSGKRTKVLSTYPKEPMLFTRARGR